MATTLKRPIPETSLVSIREVDVDVALARRGWRRHHLAKKVKRTNATVSQAINHGIGQPTIKAIARELGIKTYPVTK